MISIQTERVGSFRSSKQDVVACISQSSPSLSVCQFFKSPDFSCPDSSIIIPGAVHCVASSLRGDMLGIIVGDKCGISRSHAVEFEYFNVSGPTESDAGMQFSPTDDNHVGILLGRDVRIYDIAKSFCLPSSAVPKPLAVISGAAAQATPVSFSYDPNSPDLLVSGWDIPNNQYLRIVDLREGTHRSVRILKTPSIYSISLSQVDNRYIASSSDLSISVFDMRKLCVPKSSSRVDPLFTLPTTGRARDLSWSPLKRATLACSGLSGIKIWRPEINRVTSVSPDDSTYVWSRFEPNCIITHNATEKRISPVCLPEFPIPIFDPRTGSLGLISSTTGQPRILHHSELHKSVEAISEKLGESSENSLIDALVQSDDETNLCQHLDWAFPDKVSVQSVEKPILERIRADTVKGDLNRFGLVPLHSESSRLLAIESLIPRKLSDKILWLINGDFEPLLRSLIAEKFPDHEFVQSLTLHVVGGSTEPLSTTADHVPEFFRIAVEMVNQLILSDRENVETVLDALANETRESHSAGPFLQCVFALMYFPYRKLEIFFEKFSFPRNFGQSVRGIVVTGLLNSNLSDQDPLQVALLGVLLTSVDHSPHNPKFEKYFKFLRKLCNQLGRDSWSLRAIIDSVLTDPTHCGSTTMVCYYCNKSLMGDEFAWNTNATGVICRCPNRGCHKPLPSCCVCLEPINVAPTATVFCTTCRHGGHKNHLVEWFDASDECAVAGCYCQCANVDGC